MAFYFSGTSVGNLKHNNSLHRVFASTGSSINDYLSSLKSWPFDNALRHISESQSFAYPASNGLTQTDR